MTNKPTIIIVEDELIITYEIKNMLNRQGFEVIDIAVSGTEALKKIKELRPDLVLMDIKLKGDMNGIEAAGKAHALYDVPVVYMTANADKETVERAKKTEPYGFLYKPVPYDELWAVVEMVLYKHSMEKALREREARLAAILNSIGDAVIAVDIETHVTGMNPAAEKLTGWRTEDAAGELLSKVFQVVNAKTGKKAVSPARKALKEGKVVGLANDTKLIARNGAEYQISDSTSPIKDKQGRITGVVLVFRDVTEQKRSSEKRGHLNKVLQSIRKVNQLITQEKDRERLIENACQLLKERGYNSAWLVLLNDRQKLISSSQSGHDQEFPRLLKRFEKGSFNACANSALKRSGVVIISDPKSTCGDCPLLNKEPGMRAMTIRLEHENRVFGLLSVELPAEFAEYEEEQALFKEVAGDIAFALYSLEVEAGRKQAEEKLLESENSLRALFNAMTDIVLEIDYEGKYISIAPTSPELLYKPSDDLIGKKLHDIFPKPEADIFLEFIRECLEENKTSTIEYPLVIDNKTIWFEGNGTPKTKNSVLYIARDITERKRAEDQIKKDLVEKTILLKEVHHRVKNNLAVLSSLVNLQSRQIHTEQQALDAFTNTCDRIRAMASVHERIYKSDDFTTIDLQGYVKKLVCDLMRIYRGDVEISQDLRIAGITLDLNRAVPCGLLLNELVTNALKHAFKGSKKGRLTIGMDIIKDQRVRLLVQDNGVGLPVKYRSGKAGSLGMVLISILTQQLHGEMSVSVENGTAFSITFPVSDA